MQQGKGQKRKHEGNASQKPTKRQNRAPGQAPRTQLAQLNAPIARGSKRQSYFEVVHDKSLPRGAIRVRGCDYIGPVSSPNPCVAGSCLANYFVNPLEFGNTRLSRFAQIYEKYLFNRLLFHYQPGVPTTAGGSLILAFDRDIDDATPTSNLDGIREYLSYQDSKTANVWEELSINCSLEARETPLYCVNNNGSTATTADDRLTYQGQIYLAAMLAPAASVQLGDVWLEYDVTFFVPAIEVQPTTAVSGQTGTTQPTAADALKGFISGVPGQSTTANTLQSMLPKNVPGIVNSAIQLAEGTYRMVNSGLCSGAPGVLTLAPPTVVANAPEPAPAPQASVRQLLNLPGVATNNSPYLSDYIIGIPRGGGYVQQGYASFLATPDTMNLDIQKLANTAAFSTTYF